MREANKAEVDDFFWNNLAYNMQKVIRQGGSLICSNKQELERLKGLQK